MIILASKSPRRIELLHQLYDSFEVMPANIDEFLYKENELSLVKAKAISEKYPNALVLSADTLVTMNGKTYGKPQDKNDAKHILKELSSNVHEVKTIYSIVYEEKNICLTKTITSKVYFNELSDELIDQYIATSSPMDKAGAYGIQDKEFPLINKIEGSYTNIVGFPIENIKEDLINLGLWPNSK